MGGSAVLIYGSITEPERFEAGKGIKGKLSAFLGRGPKITDLGSGHQFIELPAGNLSGLASEFKQYLKNKIEKPWTGTSLLLDSYLDGSSTSVYVRGERTAHSEDKWYVQLTFSGCAGLTEVSAELACHWAEIWYDECRDWIAEKYFAPYGFLPHPKQERSFAGHKFLPLGNIGYAMFVDKFKWTPPLEHYFEIDGAYGEFEEFGDTLDLLDALDGDFNLVMADGSCKCQLCSPDFDAESVQKYVSERYR